jgi:hypothetical protein
VRRRKKGRGMTTSAVASRRVGTNGGGSSLWGGRVRTSHMI